MLVSNESALKRLNSPDNLMVRLKALSNKKAELSLFIGNSKQNNHNTEEAVTADEEDETDKSAKPTIDKLIDNADAQIKLATAHDKGLKLLNTAIEHLSAKLDDVKAEKLPGVITAASKVVSEIRRERNEANKNGNGQQVHHHFYLPEQKKLEDYDIIDVAPIEADK